MYSVTFISYFVKCVFIYFCDSCKNTQYILHASSLHIHYHTMPKEKVSGSISYKVCVIIHFTKLYARYSNIKFFKIWYDQSSQKLMTTIVKCEDLPKKDRLSQSDGYVKVFLLPGKNKLKTKVVKKNNNPEFNETFSFEVRSLLIGKLSKIKTKHMESIDH